MLPPRLSLALLPTPLQPLDRLSAQLGGPTIWVKRDDLTGAVLSGNKVRKLEFTLAQVQAEQCDTIITCGGLQSNHCRATAVLCAQLGLHCVLVLRGETDAPFDGNLLLDWLAGAEIRCYPVSQYQHRLPELLAQAVADCRAQGRRPYVIPTGASDGVGVWGYIAACEELRRDFLGAGISPRHIVCATGSGGTQAGLTAGIALFGIDATVWGMAVCDDEAYFLRKVRSDLEDWQQRYQTTLDLDALTLRVLDQYVGPGYAKAAPAVFSTIAEVARLEGLVLDPVYTGKAFHGMLQELRAGRFDDSNDVVFIHTGGVFGLFPQRDQFSY